MLARIGAVAQNTYREAVRARILLGLFALAIATAAYCLIVGQFALRSSFRVVSDLGAASISLFGVVVAIVLGATSLHRELELKTVFPILARPIFRWEYVVGKFLGALATLAVFIAANAGVLLVSLAVLAGDATEQRELGGVILAIVVVSGILARQLPRWRTYIPGLAAVALLAASWPFASGAADDRRVILGSVLLSLGEVAVITALATLSSSFTSPFLTAVFTFGIFIVGRSADTLARLPERFFGHAIHVMAVGASKIVPNLMVYVPPRTLLTGEGAGGDLGSYLLLAGVQALGWTVGLLALAAAIFKRRDFL